MGGFIYTVDDPVTNSRRASGIFASESEAWKAMYAEAKRICGNSTGEIQVSPQEISLSWPTNSPFNLSSGCLTTIWKLYPADFSNEGTVEDNGHWTLINLSMWFQKDSLAARECVVKQFAMFVPKNVSDEEQYARNLLREMVRYMLTGLSGYQCIRMTDYSYNWDDFVQSLTDNVMKRFQCYLGHYAGLCSDSSAIDILVNRNECLLASCEPAMVSIGIPGNESVRFAADVDMTSGHVKFRSDKEHIAKQTNQTLWLTFDGRSDSESIRLYKSKEEAEEDCEVFWLG